MKTVTTFVYLEGTNWRDGIDGIEFNLYHDDHHIASVTAYWQSNAVDVEVHSLIGVERINTRKPTMREAIATAKSYASQIEHNFETP